jgi:hypothetical protein
MFSPNTMHRSEVLDYWKTIDDDYHWHIEILPVWMRCTGKTVMSRSTLVRKPASVCVFNSQELPSE